MATIEKLKIKKFIIPIYQRNYAWTDIEINQFIDDINFSKNENYHIGSLVLFDKENNLFEVVDGQQRLITIALILYALNEQSLNLEFEARDENNKILKQLSGNDLNTIKNSDNELIYAYFRYIIPKLKEIEDLSQLKNLSVFTSKLKEAVILNENILPPDVNLHHYFERMNSRGKQLELHSVLRAKLLKNIEVIGKFEKWDKCSELNEYSKFENLIDIKNDKRSLLNILENPIIPKTTEDSKIEEKFGSIIDFPNFLLIALRVFKNDSNVILNNEQLLTQFGYYKENFDFEPTEFLCFLVELKRIFDKFIIKRSYNDSQPYWILKDIETDKNTFSISKISSDDELEYDDIERLQKKIVKIQSMLHASYPSNNYKDWLYETLNFIWNNNKNDQNFGSNLFNFLENYAIEKFKSNLGENNLPIETGLEIPRIVFYFTDYLLWKLYIENVRGTNTEISNSPEINSLIKRIEMNKHIFNTFNFRIFSSIEHLYPQNPDNKKYIDPEKLNSFGNLCLISRSSNSRYSNLEPSAKREHSKNSNLNESLKQAIMYQILEDDSIWDIDQIAKNENEIKELIKKYI